MLESHWVRMQDRGSSMTLLSSRSVDEEHWHQLLMIARLPSGKINQSTLAHDGWCSLTHDEYVLPAWSVCVRPVPSVEQVSLHIFLFSFQLGNVCCTGWKKQREQCLFLLVSRARHVRLTAMTTILPWSLHQSCKNFYLTSKSSWITSCSNKIWHLLTAHRRRLIC